MTHLKLFILCIATSFTGIGCSTTDTTASGDSPRNPADSNIVLMKVELNGVERPIIIELYPQSAPNTVANFKKLIGEGYYNGMAFHRIIPRYLAQTGDPLTKESSSRDSWGTGNPGYVIPAEIGLPHKRGSLAMARLGDAQNPSKESNGSQFYIALAKLKKLDGEYTVFGEVTQGLKILDQMSKAVVDTNDTPVKRIGILSMNLIPANAVVEDKGGNRGVGGRTNTVPESRKGPFTKFIERIW